MVTNIYLVKEFKKRHPFHIVEVSPWPFLISLSALMLTVSFVSFFQGVFFGLFSFIFSFFLVFLIFTFWCFDVLKESELFFFNVLSSEEAGFFLREKKVNYKIENSFLIKQLLLFSPTFHTEYVRFGLKFGFVLFIISEVMFFFSFFWAYFHSSLAPTIQIGSIWPSSGLVVIDPWGVPFLNTIILVTSGATLTFAHYTLIECQNVYNILDKFIFTKIIINTLNISIKFLRDLNIRVAYSLINVFFFFFYNVNFSSTIYYFAIPRVCECSVFYIRWCLWLYFFYGYRVSWFTCNNWYRVFIILFFSVNI